MSNLCIPFTPVDPEAPADRAVERGRHLQRGLQFRDMLDQLVGNDGTIRGTQTFLQIPVGGEINYVVS